MENEFFKPILKGGSKEVIDHYIFQDNRLTKNIPEGIYEGLDDSIKKIKFFSIGFDSLQKLKSVIKEGKFLEFSDCSFGEFDLSEISNCRIIFSSSIRKISGSLTFLHCKNLEIFVSVSTNFPSLDFFNCTKTILRTFNAPKILLTTYYSDCEDCVIDVNLFSTFQFSLDSRKSTFEKIKISKCKISKFHVDTDSSFNELELNNILSDAGLNLDISNFGCELIQIYNCKFKYIEVQGRYYGSFEPDDILIEYSYIRKISILNSTPLKINNLKIFLFTIEGTDSKDISISQSVFSNITLKNFSIAENVKFNSNFELDMDKLKLENSILNGLEINPSFLHHFSQFEFKNSSLEGIKIVNFSPISQNSIERSNDMTINQKIDFTRELAELMVKQGNRYLATVYKALEQDFRLQSNNFTTKSDKIILTLNSLSNAHGTKPEKAFILMLGLIFIHFLAMRVEFAWFNDNLLASDFFWNNLSYYIKPITFISDINYNEYSFSKPFVVLDFFYKISFGYLLYQFIAAFRKFNK